MSVEDQTIGETLEKGVRETQICYAHLNIHTIMQKDVAREFAHICTVMDDLEERRGKERRGAMTENK